MNPPSKKEIRHQPRNWPLPRLIAFSSTMITLSAILIFVIAGVSVNYFTTKPGDQSLLVPVMGAVLLAGTAMASLGLTCGVIDLVNSTDRRGISVITVFINGGVCLFVTSVVVIGFLNQ